MNRSPIHRIFASVAQTAVRSVGTPYAFGAAVLLIVCWLLAGPYFHFSTAWSLWINSTTTIVTFVMVFLIQSAQNTGDAATHLKLDALLEADAKDDDRRFIGIEDLTEPELKELRQVMRAEIDAIRGKR